MGKFVAPDRGVKETVVGGRSYYAGRNGLYEVNNAAHAKAMKAEGFFEASLNPVAAGDRMRGFTCGKCGFEGWFRKCGRCGHEQSAENNPPRDGE